MNTKYLTLATILSLVIIGGLFALILPQQAVQAAPGVYTAANGKIYKGGNEIVLKGLNWFGFEESGQYRLGGTWTSVKWTSMITNMQNLGFNAVRLPVCPTTLTNASTGYVDAVNTELVGKTALQQLDTVVNEFSSRGMYVLLDMHRPECTAITPLWYTTNYTEAEWIDDLEFMANRYKNVEYFMGIDLSNEPHGATWGAGNNATDWNKAAERAGAAVNAANPNILIFVEGVGPDDGNSSCNWTENTFWGENLVAVRCNPISTSSIPANKLIYSPHVYGPSVAAQSYFNAGNFPNNMPAIWEDHWGYLTDSGYTLAFGEWGGTYVGNDKVWQDAFVDYLIDIGACHSFHWSWNPNSGDTGGIVQNDWQTPESAKVANIQRYFNNCNTSVSGSSSSSTSSTSSSSSSSTTAGSQAPFGGTPLAIPGRLQVEDFDEGGQGVAYSDSDSINEDSANYRTGGVDIADYGSGRYVVGYTQPDEWLEYTVNIGTTGNYDLTAFAVTADEDGQSRTFSISVDDVNVGTFVVPNQDSWNDFVNVDLANIALTAGEHIIRINFTDYGVNLDYIDFTLTDAAECKADYNEDDTVDIADFAIFAANYKKSGINASLDLVGSDAYLSIADFSYFATAWGDC